MDFVWRALRAVLEIDSDTHHALAGDADRTSHRHLWLETDGYSTTHRTPRSLTGNPTQFIADIGRWLAGRAALVR